MQTLISSLLTSHKSTEDNADESETEEIKVDHSKDTDLLRVDVHSTDNNRIKISVIAPTLQKPLKRLPVMISCVVDTSGSMGCDAVIKDENGKAESHGLSILDLVKHSIATIIESLNSKDYLSVVAYADKAQIITKLMKMSKKNKKKTLKALQELQAEGQTNLWDGLFHGLEQLRKCKGIDTFNSNSTVMLFTDGLPNCVPPKGHIPMLNDYTTQHKHLNGCINTYGFGYSLDTKLLTELAAKGNGYYAFIPDSTMVGTIFVHSISNLLSNVAKNVTLKVAINDKYDSEIIGGYDCVIDKNEIEILLGNVMYGQNKDIIIQLKPRDNEEKEGKNDGNALDISKSSLNYISLRNHKYISTGLQSNESTESEQKTADINKVTEICYQRLLACDVLRACMKSMQLKDIKTAQDQLRQLIKTTEANQSLSKDKFITDLLTDLSGQCFEAISKEECYDKWGKHYLPSIIFAHLHCFCNNFKDPGVQHYGGALFNTLRDKANDIFIKMPAPKPSYKPPAWLKDFGDVNVPAQAAPNVAMSSYMNAGGGCFHPYCMVEMSDGKLKFVKDVCVGDMVGSNACVLCVVKYKCKDGRIRLTTVGSNKLKITPYHPVKNGSGNEWVFPIDINGSVTVEEECTFVYNFVLSNGHVLNVNGVQCCTLAHGFKENEVIEHEYFGSDKVLEDLRKCNGWRYGQIVLGYDCFQRDPDSNLICKLIQ